MMLKSTILAASALLASVAVALDEEHNLDMEEVVLSGIDKFIPDEGKFYSFVSHLGQPAMHDEIEDSKLQESIEYIRLFHIIESSFSTFKATPW